MNEKIILRIAAIAALPLIPIGCGAPSETGDLPESESATTEPLVIPNICADPSRQEDDALCILDPNISATGGPTSTIGTHCDFVSQSSYGHPDCPNIYNVTVANDGIHNATVGVNYGGPLLSNNQSFPCGAMQVWMKVVNRQTLQAVFEKKVTGTTNANGTCNWPWFSQMRTTIPPTVNNPNYAVFAYAAFLNLYEPVEVWAQY